MSLLSLFVIAIGLSMDAFAVSICKGLAMGKMKWKNALIAGAYFGGFQALMPLIGYILGSQFESYIKSIDHWIAFVLLGLIGAHMIKESFQKEDCEANDSFDVGTMLVLAVATSIDALAVGVSFACLRVQIIPAVCSIGAITFVCSVVGVKIGSRFGSRYRSKAELAGGIILVVMAFKILFEHLGILG